MKKAYLLAVLSALLGVEGCVATEGARSSSPTVIDSGVLLGEYPNIYWMDNRTVIFEAAGGSYCVKQGGYKQPLNEIVMFDTETRQVLRYGEPGVNGLCFSEGNISYARRVREGNSCTTDRFEHYMGKLGVEALTRGVGKISKYTCRPEFELPPLPEWTKGERRFRRLRPEHGFLEYEQKKIVYDGIHEMDVSYPIRLHKPGAEQKEGIPIHGLETLYSVTWSPRYDKAKGGYWLAGTREEWAPKRKTSSYLWVLHPDGRLEQMAFAITDDPDWQNRPQIVRLADGRAIEWPVRAGFGVVIGRGVLGSGGSIDRQGNLGASGLYYWNGKDTKRLAMARISELSVSPDGCKAAMGIDAQNPIGPDRYVLHIVDACKGEKK